MIKRIIYGISLFQLIWSNTLFSTYILFYTILLQYTISYHIILSWSQFAYIDYVFCVFHWILNLICCALFLKLFYVRVHIYIKTQKGRQQCWSPFLEQSVGQSLENISQVTVLEDPILNIQYLRFILQNMWMIFLSILLRKVEATADFLVIFQVMSGVFQMINLRAF